MVSITFVQTARTNQLVYNTKPTTLLALYLNNTTTTLRILNPFTKSPTPTRINASAMAP
jgi:hypothetical protein